MKKLRRGHLLSYLLPLLLCSKTLSLCVSRSHFGDEFVNTYGSIGSCVDRGAACSDGATLGGEVARVGQQCACEVDEMLSCPACKCNYIYSFFNGTNCVSGRSVGWMPRDDLIQPNVNYTQLIAIGKAFPYPTKVYAWKVRVKNNRTNPGWLLIQTWRPKIGGFALISVTNFTYFSSRGSGYTDTEISMHEGGEIAVDRGDVIGLFLPSGIQGAPFAIGYADPGVSVVPEDGSKLLFFETSSDQQPPTELTTVDYDEHVTQFVINIHAIIGPVEEGGKECIAPPTMRRPTTEPEAPPQGGNSPLDVEYIRMIVVPIIIVLLFLILVAVGVAVVVVCVRSCRSSRRKEKKYQEPRVTSSLDTLERSSVYNIYPPNPVIGTQRTAARCTVYSSPNSKRAGKGSTSGCSESIYETISERDLSPRSGSSSSDSSVPHTYAVLERPLLLSDKQTCTSGRTVTHSQVQEAVQVKPDKLEKRLSTKDNLTGQENEHCCSLSGIEASKSDTETDAPEELSTAVTREGMPEEEVDDNVFQLEEVDSEFDIQIYRV